MSSYQTLPQADQMSASDGNVYEALRDAEQMLVMNKPKSRDERFAQLKRLREEYKAERITWNRKLGAFCAVLTLCIGGSGLWHAWTSDPGTQDVDLGIMLAVLGLIIVALTYFVFAASAEQDERSAWADSGYDDLSDPADIERLAHALKKSEVARSWAKKWVEKSGRTSVEDARILIRFVNCTCQVEAVASAREELKFVLQIEECVR